MRILHISSLYPPQVVGGAEKSVQLLAEAQLANGHEVSVTCLTKGADYTETVNGVHVSRVNHRSPIWIEDQLSASRSKHLFAKMLQSVNADQAEAIDATVANYGPHIVHTHSMVGLTAGIWPKIRRRGIPICHTVRDYDLLCSNSAMFRNGQNCEGQHVKCRALSFDKKVRSRSIDGVVGISGDVLQRHLGAGLFRNLPAELRTVIWNSAPEVNASAVATARAARLIDPEFKFGYLGRLTPEKGIGTLLAAARLLPGHGWSMSLAGKENDFARESLRAAQHLPVNLIGFTDPSDFFPALDVLVVPSIWSEPLGRIVLEAYANGVPVLGSRAGGIPELIGKDNNDWLFPAGDAGALAEKMLNLIIRGKTALPTIEAFTGVLDMTAPQEVAARYEEFYSQIITSYEQ